jgi:hypothetical protein
MPLIMPLVLPSGMMPIEKEMKNVRVAFDVLGDGVTSPPDHQYIC